MSLTNDFSQSTVTVKKTELLLAIKSNREKHLDEFLKAQEGYREEVIKVLDRRLAEMREGKPFLVETIWSLTMPHEHTKDYDRVIRMLEMSIADEVTISEQQFMQY